MIVKKIERINALKREVHALTTWKEWDDAFLQQVKTLFTYNTNKLEGSTLTLGQTIELLKEIAAPRNCLSGEKLDMIHHQEILDRVFASYRSDIITTANMLSLHKALMKNPAQWEEDGLYSPGACKQFENATVRSNGRVHRYLAPKDVPAAMEALVADTNRQLSDMDEEIFEKHPLVICTWFHQRFLDIHPFADGNGRIGRIFVNLMLMKAGYPPIFIQEVDRIAYLKAFDPSDRALHPMFDFMADRLMGSLEMKLDFVQGLREVGVSISQSQFTES